MDKNSELSQDLSQRIDSLTARSTVTRAPIIEDALSRGRSLAWQEPWIAGVQAGIEDADRREFATDEEIAARAPLIRSVPKHLDGCCHI